jgi:hypothetical protein
MFAAIARSLFDAYKRQGATVRVVWHPSSGEPVCEGDGVRAVIAGEGTFSGERYSIDTVEVIKAEFRDLRQSEIVSVDGTDYGVRDIASDDGVFLRLVIGVPDHGSCA